MNSRENIESQIRIAAEASDFDTAVDLAVAAYGAALVGYITTLVRRDSALAEDVVQETFVAAWKGLATFEWRSTCRLWLYRIARGIACNELRRPDQKRVRPLQTGEADHLAARLARTATAEWRKTENRSRMWDACRELPEIERTVVALRLRDRMSWNDIAQVVTEHQIDDDAELRRQAAALRKRFERAKKRLRELVAT